MQPPEVKLAPDEAGGSDERSGVVGWGLKGKYGAEGPLEGAHVCGDTGRDVADIAGGYVLFIGQLDRLDMAGIALRADHQDALAGSPTCWAATNAAVNSIWPGRDRG